MRCPVCKKPTDPKYSPFCSRRCADIDLGRWLTGSYVIPGPEGEMDNLPTNDDSHPPAGGADSSDF